MKGKLWTIAEREQAFSLRDSGLEYPAIAKQLGRTQRSVQTMFARQSAGTLVLERVIVGWTKEQLAELSRLTAEGKTAVQIAPLMQRTVKAVQAKLQYLRQFKKMGQPLRTSTEPSRASQDTIAEWRRRLATSPRDLTAALCGDPLPGYSALERRA